MSCLGVDEEFLKKKERPHVNLQKLKIKWKATLNLELFIQKMSWRMFWFVLFHFVFQEMHN